MLRVALFVSLAAWALLPSCTCTNQNGVDAGPDGGAAGEGEGEGAAGEGEGTGPDGGPVCDENSTEGVGDPCASRGEDPPCGTQHCDPITNALKCIDQGDNACGACGDLDQSLGRLGAACGVELCGIGTCDIDPTKTECQNGDTLRNECGGCAALTPAGTHPGDLCSTCQTGVRTCTTDEDNMVCFRGREPTNACGGCGRCVLFHAFMQDESAGGGFLLPGTVAIIESVDNSGVLKLSFDPLIAGPGAGGIPDGEVFLSTTQNAQLGFSVPVTTADGTVFTTNLPAPTPKVLLDPVRLYDVIDDPSGFQFVVLMDLTGIFPDPVISWGVLEPGAPPSDGTADAGVVVDSGVPVDSGPVDSGPVDSGVVDSGPVDSGPVDSGVVDSGVIVDAG